MTGIPAVYRRAVVRLSLTTLLQGGGILGMKFGMARQMCSANEQPCHNAE